MGDFGTVLKIENNSSVEYSLKDIFSGLVEEPEICPYDIGTSGQSHCFLRFSSPVFAEYAFTHKRDLADVYVLPVQRYPAIIEQYKGTIHRFLTSMEKGENSRIDQRPPGIASERVSQNVSAQVISYRMSAESFDATEAGSLVSEVPMARAGQIYACSSSQVLQSTFLATHKQRGSSADSIASSAEDGLSKDLTITPPPFQFAATYPLTCESRISLTLCGEIITYDLESMPSDPHIVIELLKATKSERGNYMIAGAFYRRMGHPASAKAVLMSMLEELSSRGVVPENLQPAFLLLSGCELDLAKLAKVDKRDASEHYLAAQTWLQKVFGKAKPGKTPIEQEENRQGSAKNLAANRSCTCSRDGAFKFSSRDINRMEREIQSLRDRNSNQESQMSSLRSSKRKLEDDFFYERDVRRKYQRRLDDLEKERDAARKIEAYALEQVKMEILARKRAEERISV